jgi:hypothetical protein
MYDSWFHKFEHTLSSSVTFEMFKMLNFAQLFNIKHVHYDFKKAVMKLNAVLGHELGRAEETEVMTRFRISTLVFSVQSNKQIMCHKYL